MREECSSSSFNNSIFVRGGGSEASKASRRSVVGLGCV